MVDNKLIRFEMRADAAFIAAVDEWRRKETDLPNRSEAIRRLVEQALKASTKPKAAKARPRVPQPMVRKMPGIQTD